MCCDLNIPGTHLSFVLPPKQGLFQSKQESFGFPVFPYKWSRFRYSFGVCFFPSEKLRKLS